jgi:dTDP-4-amino-4,6-dideoxygalactose transaminase
MYDLARIVPGAIRFSANRLSMMIEPKSHTIVRRDRVSTIPPIDLARQYTTIRDEVEAAVIEIMASGRYIGGDVVTEFETEFAGYIGTAAGISCNSGTDALYLALRALAIGAGDEVIVPSFTFIATAETVSAVGATPIFVDIDPATFVIDPDRLEAAITDQTRAIIPVHLFGHPANMDRIMAIARDRGLKVIEDCAQATGAMWGEQRVGSIGDIGCFSFFPTKNLGAFGDGGMITTDDPDLAQQMRVIKEHGSPRRYHHTEIGINSRLDAMQAAILRVKLPWLDRWNAARSEVAARYTAMLAPITGLVLPQEAPGARTVWNQYTIRIDCNDAAIRDRLRERLLDRQIISMVYYPLSLHQQPVYALPVSLPESERAAREVLSLPMFPELTETEQEHIVDALKDSLLDR